MEKKDDSKREEKGKTTGDDKAKDGTGKKDKDGKDKDEDKELPAAKIFVPKSVVG
jgi:hypothetical protein